MPGNPGDERRNGNSDGNRAARPTYDSRRRRLRLCARIFAFLVVPFSAILLVAGLHIPATYVIVIAVVQVVVWTRVNRRAATHVEENAPPPGTPGLAPCLPMWRHGCAVIAALAVGILALFWWFDRDLEDRWHAAEAWKVPAQVLRTEDEQQRAVIEKPLPSVDADPEIISLRNTLDQARRDYPKVRDDVVCEADGTCGSGKKGRRENYEEKVRRRDQLKTEIEVDLPRAIERRSAAVNVDIAAVQEVKKAAQSRRERISRILSEGPTWSNRWGELNEIASTEARIALAVALTAGILHFGLDVLPLQITARRICSRRPRPETEAPDSTIGPQSAAADEPDGLPIRDSGPPGVLSPGSGPYSMDFSHGMWLPDVSGPATPRPRSRWWRWRRRKVRP